MWIPRGLWTTLLLLLLFPREPWRTLLFLLLLLLLLFSRELWRMEHEANAGTTTTVSLGRPPVVHLDTAGDDDDDDNYLVINVFLFPLGQCWWSRILSKHGKMTPNTQHYTGCRFATICCQSPFNYCPSTPQSSTVVNTTSLFSDPKRTIDLARKSSHPSWKPINLPASPATRAPDLNVAHENPHPVDFP